MKLAFLILTILTVVCMGMGKPVPYGEYQALISNTYVNISLILHIMLNANIK